MLRSSFARLLAFATLLGFAACSKTTEADKNGLAKLTSQTTMDFPKLLDRAPELRNGKEWDDVQNFYGSQCATLRNNPNDAEAKVKLAECFMQEARVTGEHPHYYPAAMKMLEQVIAVLSETDFSATDKKTVTQKDLYFRALSHKASVQLSLHDFAGAKETAQKATVLNPYNAYIYGCLVDANVELGNYTEAVAMCDKMVGIRPDLRSYSRVSYLREIYGDLPGAIEAMDMAVKAGYPGAEQTEWARLQLGALYEQKGNLNAAENQYNMSLAVREKYPFAIAALANIEEKRGNLAKAEELLKQAADIIPEIGFYIDLARIYQKTGRKADLEKLLPEIKNMFAEDIAAGHNMSLEAARFNLDLTGDLDKALEFANDEYARRPENIQVNKLLADIYKQKGDAQKAALHQQKAVLKG